MRLNSSLLKHAETLLSQLLRHDYSADSVVSRYFREHRELGHTDRGFVAETVYAILRRKRSLMARCGDNVTSRRLTLAYLACVQGLNNKELETVTSESELKWLGEIKAIKQDSLPPAVKLDFPDWLYEALVAQFGEDNLPALAQSLNKPAPLDLRVNTLKAERDAVLAQFEQAGIAAEACTYSPAGIRLKGKPSLSKNALFLDGSIEVQDEGSQLLGYLLQPKRGEMVADFCAGAGGKTLALGAMMRSQGRLYAFDVSEKRLSKLKPRLARSGLSNVHPVRIETEHDTKVKRLGGKIDRVLVDAPCSGLGTLRRNPDLKWKQTPESVAELTAKQASILSSAAGLVKKGGRLVYATCSLLAAENEEIVNAFLATHPDFQLLSAASVLEKQGIHLASGEMLRLSPHEHGTDGFFAAVLERNAS